tara:strand:+ start:1237 stop:1650 length:414 start_codon:yes stop_codon:yes gene_type:complete
MKNIFDWLKEINYHKSPSTKFTESDWEVWNSYMIHRFISMNKDYIEIANYVQEFPPQEKVLIYNVYKEFLPKNNKWNKYIKSKSKSYNKELLINLSDHWKCSQREVKEYISMLDNKDIVSILSDRGLSTKEIKPLLK